MAYSSTRQTLQIVPISAPSISCMAQPVRGLTVDRRSANYNPDIWDFDFIQSLTSDYKGEIYEKRFQKLKEDVRHILNDKETTQLVQLELIEALQRLGIRYIFEKDIERILDSIATSNNINSRTEEGLHAVALRFRLLRQHGYQISPQDTFNVFKDCNDLFKESICEDVKGVLSLYEASHFALEGEDILDEAKAFTTRYLKDIKESIDPVLAERVNHALELPLHWRMLRLEARWYIEACGKEDNISRDDVLQLAKLNFNMVQATQQEELREVCRWWRNLDLASHLSFIRDRQVESFCWSSGTILDPQFSYCRKEMAKLAQLITTIDDVYDVYGSLDELELFTHVVERWDINELESLPNYMKLCFLALYNTINEMVYVAMKKHSLDILPCLKKMWADLCKAYLVEARWFHNKYTPTLAEYLDNACVSISGPLALAHAYLFSEQEITQELLESLKRYPNIILYPSMIVRLSDDLGTSKDELARGDVPKSVQCYMYEHGVSEEVACEHIKHLINESWKKMNKERIENSLFSKTFIETAMNMARSAQFIYQYGDGHGVSNGETIKGVWALFIEPMLLA